MKRGEGSSETKNVELQRGLEPFTCFSGFSSPNFGLVNLKKEVSVGRPEPQALSRAIGI